MTKPDIDRLTAIERDWRRAANDLQHAADQAMEAVATVEQLAAEPEPDPQDKYVAALESAVHIAHEKLHGAVPLRTCMEDPCRELARVAHVPQGVAPLSVTLC
jgi:hypothetical protein